MTRPVVLLDVDGVLANFIEASLRVLRAVGVSAEHDDVTSWHLEDSLGLTNKQRGWLMEAWSEPGFCSMIPPYAGAREGVDALREVADVYAVTAPMWSSPTWQGERTEWLVKHFAFDRKDVVSTHAKYLVAGDVLVDDKPETVAKWRQWGRITGRGHTGLGVLWDRPYNRNTPESVGLMRSASWSAVARLVTVTGLPMPDRSCE